MKIPNLDKAEVPEAKVLDYLLSLTHPDGVGEAGFFTQFGFSSASWAELAQALLRHAADHEDDVVRFNVPMADAESVDDIQRESSIAQVAFQFLGRGAAQALSPTIGQGRWEALFAQIPDGDQVPEFAPDGEQLHYRRASLDRGLLHEFEFLIGPRQHLLVENIARHLNRARSFKHVPQIDSAKTTIAEMPQARHAGLGFEHVENFEIHDVGSDSL